MSQQLRTPKQQQIVDALVENFNIDGSKVLFFPEDPDEPWLRARQLAQIARQSGKFKLVTVEPTHYWDALKQIFYQGTVVDQKDVTYSLPGVATINEKIEALGQTLDANDLAESRALRSTLQLAGFDPLDPASVVPLGDLKLADHPRDPDVIEAESRRADLARIHMLAKEKCLIVEGGAANGADDLSGYRRLLLQWYGVNTAAGFRSVERKSLIEALERYTPPAEEAENEFDVLQTEAVA
jgi:hypothetical protein